MDCSRYGAPATETGICGHLRARELEREVMNTRYTVTFHLPPKIQAFVDSVDVIKIDYKLEKGRPTPVYNVYASGYFIRTPKLWTKIRDYLAVLKYSDPKIGRATVEIALFDCKICHGVDHPRGLCKFPKIKRQEGTHRHCRDHP